MDGDRDTYVTDIIENDKKERSFDFPNQLNKKAGKNEAMVIDNRDDVIEHKKDDSTAANLIKKNEAIQHTEVDEVTSVTDDCDDVIEHFNDGCHQKQEVESIAVDEMIKPVDCLHVRIVENSLILQKEKLYEDFAQHGPFTMEFAIEEDFTEVFANQSIVH